MTAKCPFCSKVFRPGLDEDSELVKSQGRNWWSCQENEYWKLKFHVTQAHPNEGHLCPRRHEGGPLASVGRDHWDEVRGVKDCSYCGSISPDDLFKAIEQGCEITPTDKSYKIYIDLIESSPNELRVSGTSNSQTKPTYGGDAWVAEEDLTPAQVEILERDNWKRTKGNWYNFSPRGVNRHAKFYFQHLSPDEQIKFVHLMNDKKIKLGYPGYFYTKPFFVTYEKPKLAE